jgi:DNA-directed RNA polymerase subunit H (RpoH/RPB5)
MSFQALFNEKDQIIESHLHENFTWATIEKMVPELSKLISEKKCNNILLDFRASKIDLPTLKIYLTPDKLSEEFKKFGINILNLRRAILVISNDENYRFLETVSLNQSQKLRIFSDENLAKEWLAIKPQQK